MSRVMLPRRRLAPSLIWILLLAAAGPALAEAPSMARLREPEAIQLTRYDGDWLRIHDAEEDADRLASIETATEELSWFMRRMAATILKQTTVPPGVMRFSWDGERLHQVVESVEGPLTHPLLLDGEPETRVATNGKETTTAWRWTEAGLEINWQQEQAHGRNVYRVDPGGQILIVEHHIQVTALDGVAPIVFRSRFDRPKLSAISRASPPSTPADVESR